MPSLVGSVMWCCLPLKDDYCELLVWNALTVITSLNFHFFPLSIPFAICFLLSHTHSVRLPMCVSVQILCKNKMVESWYSWSFTVKGAEADVCLTLLIEILIEGRGQRADVWPMTVSTPRCGWYKEETWVMLVPTVIYFPTVAWLENNGLWPRRPGNPVCNERKEQCKW